MDLTSSARCAIMNHLPECTSASGLALWPPSLRTLQSDVQCIGLVQGESICTCRRRPLHRRHVRSLFYIGHISGLRYIHALICTCYTSHAHALHTKINALTMISIQYRVCLGRWVAPVTFGLGYISVQSSFAVASTAPTVQHSTVRDREEFSYVRFVEGAILKPWDQLRITEHCVLNWYVVAW